jgi:inorganic pyrophosphatase
MNNQDIPKIWNLMGQLFRSHPWHGVPVGERSPDVVTAYIEMTPTDTIKYELDKATGIRKVDRPQLYSNVCPALYGLIPQTYCAERTAALSMARTGRIGIAGDGDPLDICILTEKHISHGNILMQAVPIGGLRLLDGNEADDKIIAVMKNDAAYQKWHTLEDCPESLITRLRHYFLTYKQSPDALKLECEITDIYGRDEAHEVIRASQDDYTDHFGGLAELLKQALGNVAAASRMRDTVSPSIPPDQSSGIS